jgi:glyoxylase-like metal-dependent hydrolase (beta-lactamase superfamily II)
VPRSLHWSVVNWELDRPFETTNGLRVEIRPRGVDARPKPDEGPASTSSAIAGSRFVRVVGAVMPAPEPVPVDETLTADGCGTRPGHTAGHASFLLDLAGGVLFAGDAARSGRTGRIQRRPKMVTEDAEAESASISRLADLRCDAAVFGHGRAISHDAAQRFREFAAQG